MNYKPRQCTKCLQLKPTTDFGWTRESNGTQRVRSHCHECRRKARPVRPVPPICLTGDAYQVTRALACQLPWDNNLWTRRNELKVTSEDGIWYSSKATQNEPQEPQNF